MAASANGSKSSHSQARQCSPEKEINILLMGQTGVGKSTFINAYANYLIYDTFDQAMDAEMEIVISSSFAYTDPDTFEQQIIKISDETAVQEVHENGQSCTQQCRSYVFPIGDRNIRLIDTPGMGDTRGSEQDSRNLFEILTYISHYEHLNGICIFLKPNETRLNIAFRLCIKEILHHLHDSARENLIFIFTNARSTFFTPGSSKKLLQVLLDEHQNHKPDLDIPFSKENTFLLDNEPYTGLVLRKNNVHVAKEQMDAYRNSWDHSVKEYQRIFSYINSRPLHALSSTLSLNEAEQLIRKLPRPVAEILRLIQQNIQLIEEYKQNLLKNGQNGSCALFQNYPDVTLLKHPILVCVHNKCSQMLNNSDEQPRVSYKLCQKRSYLSGGLQEVINSRTIVQCDVIDKDTDKCKACNHSSERHMNITYEFKTNLKTMETKNNENDSSSSADTAEKHLHQLQREQSKILDVYKKLSKFLQLNTIHPLKDEIIYYFKLFIREEEMKRKEGIRNDDVIEGLKKILAEYENEMNAFKENLAGETEKLKDEEIFPLVGTLYRLSHNGRTIRCQVDFLKFVENRAVASMERHIELPEIAASSKIMQNLVRVVTRI